MLKEYKIILLATLTSKTEEEKLELQSLIDGELNWEIVVGQLLHHRLCGYFYMGLSAEQRKRLNKEVRKILELIVQAQRKQVLETYEVLQPIIKEFDKEGIRYAGLKGVIYNTTIYEIGARRSNDTDILVLEDDLDKIDRILRDRGYIQTLLKNNEYKEASRKEKLIQRMNYHDLVPYIKLLPDNDFAKFHEMDINFHFDSKQNDITKAIFNFGTEHYKSDNMKIKGLPWQTNLAHLCVHFYREGSNVIWTSRKRDMVLYKIVDIINIIRYINIYENNGNVREWPEIIKKLNLTEAAYYTLHVLSQFYNDKLVEQWLDELHPTEESFVDLIKDESKSEVIIRNKSFVETAFSQVY